MKILLAKSAGFCFGVKRASRLAFAAAKEHSCLCSLGPIIHSPQLVEKLEEQGVRVVKTLDQVDQGAVIVRSHGVTSDELSGIEERDLTMVDATCPFVKKAQEHAATLSREGYHLILVGEAEHPEVRGIVSFARNGPVTVVGSQEDAQRLQRGARLGVIAQTTQSFQNFNEIVSVCLEKSREVRIFNTICDATVVRQQEAKEIAQQVSLMLVIGGYNSANTTRLASICRDIQPKTHHLETAEDIDPAWLRGVEVVGVTAGASTPAWLIEQVISRLEST